MDESSLAREGEFHSSGFFTLGIEQAREKLAEHAMARPELASLKLVQAFTALGCNDLKITISKDRWAFQGGGGRELGSLRSLVNLALAQADEAENHFARALLGMLRWPIRAANWNGQVLWGKPAGTTDGLVLDFDSAPVFPTGLWKTRLSLTGLRVHMHGTSLSWEVLESSARAEMLRTDQTGPLQAVASGRYPAWLSQAGLLGAWHGRRQGNLYLTVHQPDSAQSSCFCPVQRGLILDEFYLKGFPPGISVAFPADGLATDLSHLRLVNDSQLQSRLREVLRLLPPHLEELARALEEATPVAADAPLSPALKVGAGLGLVSLGVLSGGNLWLTGAACVGSMIVAQGVGEVAGIGHLVLAGARDVLHPVCEEIVGVFPDLGNGPGR